MSKSKIFFYGCLFFVVGVGLASFFSLPLLAAFALFIAGCGFLFFGWSNKKIFIIIGLGGIFLFLGILRFEASEIVENENQVSFYNEQEVDFVGVVVAEPDTRDNHIKLKISSSQLMVSGERKSVFGNVLVNTKLYPTYYYGDELEINCKLQKPEPIEDFAYDKYLAKEDVYSVCYRPGEIKLLGTGRGSKIVAGIFRIKEKLVIVVNRILPEPQAAFLGGLLYGARRGIPQNLIDNFGVTGTTHIVAISGYNITILAALLLKLAKGIGFGRKKSFWISLSGIGFFVILTGAQASVVRAAIMGCLVLLAIESGRASKVTNALLMAAVVMLLINPRILAFDVGFQLSFAATFGLVFLSPIFEKYLEKFPSAFGIKESFATTMAAIIFTLPLILYNFGRLSLIAPFANILILPVIPLTMALGFMSVLGGLIYSGLGQILGWLAWFFLSYIIKAVEILAKIPWASREIGKIHWVILVLSYLIIGGFVWQQYRHERYFKAGENA